jgi:hypothetical protein
MGRSANELPFCCEAQRFAEAAYGISACSRRIIVLTKVVERVEVIHGGIFRHIAGEETLEVAESVISRQVRACRRIVLRVEKTVSWRGKVNAGA